MLPCSVAVGHELEALRSLHELDVARSATDLPMSSPCLDVDAQACKETVFAKRCHRNGMGDLLKRRSMPCKMMPRVYSCLGEYMF